MGLKVKGKLIEIIQRHNCQDEELDEYAEIELSMSEEDIREETIDVLETNHFKEDEILKGKKYCQISSALSQVFAKKITDKALSLLTEGKGEEKCQNCESFIDNRCQTHLGNDDWCKMTNYSYFESKEEQPEKKCDISDDCIKGNLCEHGTVLCKTKERMYFYRKPKKKKEERKIDWSGLRFTYPITPNQKRHNALVDIVREHIEGRK